MASITALVIVVVATGFFSVRKQRRDRKALVDLIKRDGGSVRKFTHDLIRSTRIRSRVYPGVEYTNRSGEIRKAFVEWERGIVTLYEDHPIEIWFARKTEENENRKKKKAEKDSVDVDVDALLRVVEKHKYQEGPAGDYAKAMILSIAAGQRDSIVLSESAPLPVIETFESDIPGFVAVLQQVRLIDVNAAPSGGLLDLVVYDERVLIDWQCEGESPNRVLTLAANHSVPPAES